MIHIVNQNYKGTANYIGRGSVFGNPYHIGEHGDREGVIKLYREHQLPIVRQQQSFIDLAARHKAGQNVALKCHCAPLHCHGDVIAEAIREITGTKIIRLIVAGSRIYNDYDFLCSVLDEFINHHRSEQIEIVSGRAKGADQLGERYADSRNIACRHFPAPWREFEKIGKKYAAGPVRNGWMANFASHERGYLIAFWNGYKNRSGTWDMICQATRKGLNVQYYIVGNSPQDDLF